MPRATKKRASLAGMTPAQKRTHYAMADRKARARKRAAARKPRY